MPRFEPFQGLRYNAKAHRLADVTAPPYDVIDPAQRAELAAEPYNAVRIDLPVDEDGDDRYSVACRLLGQWQSDGVLVEDSEPALTVHRMTFTDEAGSQRQTTGVIGALELWSPGAGQILPHERTTPKAVSDRLDMLRSCQANLSAIWGLSLAEGLTDLFPTDAEPDDDWVDPDGVRHTVWISRDRVANGKIAAAVLGSPVVIADGHHRYETSLQYRDEHRVRHGVGTGADSTMAYIVELAADELTVQPIHRLVSGVGDADPVDAMSGSFEVSEHDPFGPDAVDRLIDEGGIGMITSTGTYLLTPRDEAFGAEVELDTVRLEEALGSLGAVDVTYQHGVGNAVEAVADGVADLAFLMRPATIDQISAIAHGGERMPPKTTFFAPKPATGIVFRKF